MGSRVDLHNDLVGLFGDSGHVYYQTPESVKMEYPAIRYSKINIATKRANNSLYSSMRCYQIVVIDRKPDNPVIDKLLELPYCKFDRHYVYDNLHHDLFTLYY